jgi:dTDP-4-dehydrorhamnose reductase
MRVVLTGASGQLGSYLIEVLLGLGVEVVAWSGTSPGELGGVVLLPVELSDAEATARALEAADPEVIVHAAARSRAEDVRRDPAGAREVNVAATGVVS